MVISITGGVVLLVVGFLLRSIVIPVRSILSIAITFAFVYGMAAEIYKGGILNSLGIDNLSNNSDGINFLMPISACSIIIGISLDYDIFLITRIREFREEGLSTRDAIVQGVGSTGHLITCAGLVMAVAFGGLLISKAPVMAQFGFYLVAAVLYDTFIVRSFFVPTLMSL